MATTSSDAPYGALPTTAPALDGYGAIGANSAAEGQPEPSSSGPALSGWAALQRLWTADEGGGILVLVVLTGMYCGCNFFTGPLTYVLTGGYANDTSNFNSSASQISQGEFNSALNLGVSTGAFISGYAAFMAEGMNNVLLGGTAVGFLSSFLSIFIETQMKGAQICCFLLSGVACGAYLVVIPLYVWRYYTTEGREDRLYGRVSDIATMIFQCAIAVGVLLTVCIGYGIESMKSSSDHTSNPAAHLFILPTILAGLAGVAAKMLNTKTQLSNSLINRSSGQFAQRLAAGMLIAFLQQGTGISCNLNFSGLPYAADSSSQFSNKGSFLGTTLAIFGWNTLMTFAGTALYTFSTKVTLLRMFAWSAVATAVVTLTAGIASFLDHSNNSSVFVPLAFVTCFELGMGPSFYALAHRLYGYAEPPSSEGPTSSLAQVGSQHAAPSVAATTASGTAPTAMAKPDDGDALKTTAFLSACTNAVAQFTSLIFSLAYPTLVTRENPNRSSITITSVGAVCVVAAMVVMWLVWPLLRSSNNRFDAATTTMLM